MSLAVGEDAGAVDHPRLAPGFVLALALRRELQLAVAVALVVELPVVAGELRGEAGDPLAVVLVGEVRAVVAAAGAALAGERPVAAAAEDARPPRAQPGQVGADPVRVVGRVG